MRLDVRPGMRCAWRTLSSEPGFALIAVMTLALGVGSSTGIFMVANGALLRPLPYPDADRLVIVQAEFDAYGTARIPLSPPELIDIRDQTESLEQLEAIWCSGGSLTGAGDAEQIDVGFVTAGFLPTLGVPPAHGRGFTKEEDRRGGALAIMLSDGLWRRRFGGDPNILGTSVTLSGVARTVVGVMPEGFRHHFPSQAGVATHVGAWIPLQTADAAASRGLRYLRVVGRLKPGATAAQARQELKEVARRLNGEHADYASSPITLRLGNLQDDIVQPVRSTVIALLAGAALLFLIACMNFTNLLLVRATRREHEIAVRAALGANHWALFRQMFMENLSLAAPACVMGLLLAIWGLHFLQPMMPAALRVHDLGAIDANVIAFIGVTALLLPSLLGTAPMVRVPGLASSDTLRQGARAADTRGQQRLRHGLVLAEIGLSLVLLVGAGLMIRTFAELCKLDPGFRAEGVLTFRVAPPPARYKTQADRANFYRELDRRMAQTPGVEAVGGISHHPFFDGPNFSSSYLGEGTAEEKWDSLQADHRIVTPGYFEAVGARLLAGRVFTELDNAAAEKVVIIDETLARLAWPGESAIDKKLKFTLPLDGEFVPTWARVVGVVEHMRSHSLREQGLEQVYLPCSQGSRHPMTIAVRATGDRQELIAAIRREVAAIDSDLPVFDVTGLDQYVSRTITSERFAMILASVFAVVALALAAIGIYGVISFSVAQRTNEFGIRMALGALPSHIRKQVVSQGARFVLYGIGAGLLMALSLTPFLGSLVFGVRTADPITFAVVSAFLAVVVIGASYIPARRATKVDPMVALRCDWARRCDGRHL